MNQVSLIGVFYTVFSFLLFFNELFLFSKKKKHILFKPILASWLVIKLQKINRENIMYTKKSRSNYIPDILKERE